VDNNTPRAPDQNCQDDFEITGIQPGWGRIICQDA
jgi:hypothetical protein